jgi:acid phosphatase type 7
MTNAWLRSTRGSGRTRLVVATGVLVAALAGVGLAWVRTPPGVGGTPVIAAAGDVACGPADHNFHAGLGNQRACNEQATSNLLLRAQLAGVLLLGDDQYENGTLGDFRRSFAPTWGRLGPKLYPAPGNHEYNTAGAAGYFGYFGSRAGPDHRGYYSYDIGAWHFLALNSNCRAIGGCNLTSAQGRWLKADLAAHRTKCTLAYWHHPRFSSGRHGDEMLADGFWRELYAAGADVVLVGHDHDYERFSPQDPNGRADPVRGIREFVVGTGGRSHDPINRVDANSVVRNDTTFGVLELTLHPGSYDWKFVPSGGATFRDAGTAACH